MVAWWLEGERIYGVKLGVLILMLWFLTVVEVNWINARIELGEAVQLL